MRQRTLRHRFQVIYLISSYDYLKKDEVIYNHIILHCQAHDSAIKCLAMDPHEELFLTGSADGDIKVENLLLFIDVLQ
jgi:hypothetical protein